MTPDRTDAPPAGYWLLNPGSLDVFYAGRGSGAFLRAMLEWLAAEIDDRLSLSDEGVALEVIEANYEGPYPCLAARSAGGPLPADLEDRVEALTRRLLREAPAGEALLSVLGRFDAASAPAGRPITTV